MHSSITLLVVRLYGVLCVLDSTHVFDEIDRFFATLANISKRVRLRMSRYRVHSMGLLVKWSDKLNCACCLISVVELYLVGSEWSSTRGLFAASQVFGYSIEERFFDWQK